MSVNKKYFNELLCACAPENGFAQDAIEHAIVSSNITLTMDQPSDVQRIMSHYDTIIESYRRAVAQSGAAALGRMPGMMPITEQTTGDERKAA